MERLGFALGVDAGPGDTILLNGDLGTGKTTFCRGFIRGCTGQDNLAITSPTYLLDNTYDVDNGAFCVHHMDLYRLSTEEDLHILGLPSVLSESVCLIEWPSRLGRYTPEDRLSVCITPLDLNTRIVDLDGFGDIWREVLENLDI